MRRYSRYKLILFLALSGGWLVFGQDRAISLFPTTVVENLKATGQAAADIESGLEGIVQQIDQQRNLYNDNQCPVNESDSGCTSLRRQMSQTYLDMLRHMESGLPTIERTVKITKNDLERRIYDELGKGLSSTGLQNLLLDKGGNTQRAESARRLQRAGATRLSQRFEQYYQLVRTSASSSQNSLALMASGIYLDLLDAQNFITLTQQEMQRARILVELNQELGLVSEEMIAVVGGVKDIIFGEEVMAPVQIVPGSALADQEGAPFRSPLER